MLAARTVGAVDRSAAGGSVLFASGLKLLGASVELGRVDFECVGDLVDGGEARVALSALHAAVMGSVDSTPQGKCLLGGAAFFA
jgi:hypothetical protein